VALCDGYSRETTGISVEAAETVTVEGGAGNVEGAVNNPVSVIVPVLAVPKCVPFTAHVRVVPNAYWRVEVN